MVKTLGLTIFTLTYYNNTDEPEVQVFRTQEEAMFQAEHDWGSPLNWDVDKTTGNVFWEDLIEDEHEFTLSASYIIQAHTMNATDQ